MSETVKEELDKEDFATIHETLRCECDSPSHLIDVRLDFDKKYHTKDFMIGYQLDVNKGFFARLRAAFGYVFLQKQGTTTWHDTLLNSDVPKLKKLIEVYETTEV